ncbi:MAG: hypothetical protein KAI69_07865 [Deltaproteobacteria bacterium]|nr:hypothetical protein [Deltaproteobacteria bacterium]
MKINEPECVTLKRRGAEYVAQLLSGKSRQEELEFWSKRTERLRSQQILKNSKLQHSAIGQLSPNS